MYSRKIWRDHVTQYTSRYKETSNADGTITHEVVEGEIIQQGTPQNAPNFNNFEEGITNATELSALMAIEMIHSRQAQKNLTGETQTVAMTNSQAFPFNNSKKTIALSTNRDNLDYTVGVEVLSYSGGFVGDFVITDKLVNGFKIAYTGSATSVSVKVFVKGGFY
jgi:cyclophilin family peptidyl-prolyl cis-trans isomerase